jgi:hypothetical protein
MSDFTDKLKEKAKEAKDKVVGAGEDAKDSVTGHDEDRITTEAGQKDDPLTSYRDKEPMTPAKIKEHEPTAVKREMTERITEPGQTGTNSDEAAEIARKKGMAKGTAGAAETGSEYEQGANAAGTMSNKSDESTPSVSAQFSCDFCNNTYKSLML